MANRTWRVKGIGTDGSRDIVLCGHGLLVVTDTTSQTSNRRNEGHLRHPRLVSTGLGRHEADLIDLALFCRVIEPWAIHVARRVLKCPHILAEQLLHVEIAVGEEKSVVETETERIEVPHKEAVFVLVNLVKRLGLVGLDGRNRLFKHGLSVRRSTLRECHSREQDSHGA